MTIDAAEALTPVAAPEPAAADLWSTFEALVTRERDRAVRVAYHLLWGDGAAAEDVAQEAFMRAYAALPSFRGQARIDTWFLRILVNQAASYRRRRWVRDRWQRVWSGAATVRPVAGHDAELPVEPPSGDPHLRRRIATALAHLPAGQRTAFALVHLEGMSIAEAAQVMGTATGTVKSHVHRAVLHLRAELNDLQEEHHEP